MTYINRYIALSCVAASVFATSCVNEFEEGQAPVSGEGYYISLTGDVNEGGVESRAYWDINNNDETQSLAFTWESTDEMKSFVWRSNAFVCFTDNKNYSATTVTPNEADNNKAQLQITTGLSREYAEGDLIWAVSPLEDSYIGANNKVTFTLPDGFTQTVLNSTDHLKDYVLMSGTGTVDGNNSASISFKVLPAIYRFKVTNNENEELTVNEVSISGPFCNKAELIMDNGTVTPTYSVSNDTYAIKVTTPEGGLKVNAGETAYLYALVFPTNTASIDQTIELSFKGNYSGYTADYTNTAKCNTIYTYNLDSNTYYDMEVPVNKTAGGDTEKSVITLFEGENAISGWSNLPISNFYVHYLKEGDVLTVYFKDCESGTKSFQDNGTWKPLGDGAEGQIDENEKTQGFFTYTITSESAEKLKKHNLILTGDGYTITKITLTTLLECDPVPVGAIMLSDFEGHTADNDKSWTTGVTLEYPMENGNTYLRFASSSVPSSSDIWLFNCSHSSANVSNIENYVIKFDLKIEEGITGASQAQMQYVLCHNATSAKWLWVGAGFFPETTDGKWITVSRNISDINADLKGQLSFSGTTNGMYGKNIPAGICIDNFRLERKN